MASARTDRVPAAPQRRNHEQSAPEQTAPARIVCIHGHRQVLGGMQRFAASLNAKGMAALGFRYCSMTNDLPTIVDDLERAVRGFAGDAEGPVHFIGHSLGGLLVRALLARYRPDTLGRVVMLGTPHGGSEWADLAVRWRLERRVLGSVGPFLTTTREPDNEAMLATIDFPLGVIAGRTPFQPVMPRVLPRPHDGTVSVESTRIAGMADHIVLPVTHAVMPSHPLVRDQALHFLHHGEFRRAV